jgi:m7GpppX diphosphatase
VQSLRRRLQSGLKLVLTNCVYFFTVLPATPFLKLDHPSYYHLHIHIVHTDFQGGGGMAVGKAWLLDDVIEQLALLGPEGFKRKTITFILGEESDLWNTVYSKLPEIV